MIRKSGMMLLTRSQDKAKGYLVLKEKLITTWTEPMSMAQKLSKEQKKLCLMISSNYCADLIQALKHQRNAALKKIWKTVNVNREKETDKKVQKGYKKSLGYSKLQRC